MIGVVVLKRKDRMWTALHQKEKMPIRCQWPCTSSYPLNQQFLKGLELKTGTNAIISTSPSIFQQPVCLYSETVQRWWILRYFVGFLDQ